MLKPELGEQVIPKNWEGHIPGTVVAQWGRFCWIKWDDMYMPETWDQEDLKRSHEG
jgi:hypothetical protein